MTEQEAKTKWCPMARVAKPDVGVGYNRWADGIGESTATNSHCLGSGCMFWRWGFDMTAEGSIKGSIRHSTKAGYCGLAGKP